MTSLEILAKGALNLGYPLSEQQLALFELYHQILIDWNQRINLTAIVNHEDVQMKHFLDSLTVAAALPNVSQDNRLLDVGTGAGFPGIPLKILLPELRVVLLESVTKKVKFLNHLVSQLSLQGIEIVNERAENLGHNASYREQFATVVSRAVASLPTLFELTLPFCKLNGISIAQKKGDIEKEIKASRAALETLGGQLKEVRKVSLPVLEDRLLLITVKTSPTPVTYPRRPGIPAKRPIVNRGG